jgi:predicted Na+-dependent transporter
LLKTVVDAGVPALVFFAMVVVGMDLPPDEFRRIARQPKFVVAATARQFLVLPVIGGVPTSTSSPLLLRCGRWCCRRRGRRLG